MRAWVVLLAGLLIAGCSQAPGPTQDPAEDPPSQQSQPWTAPAFAAPMQVAALAAAGSDAVPYLSAKQLALFEPTMSFGPNGSLYVSAPYCPASAGACQNHPSGIWRGPSPFSAITPPAEDGVQGNGDSDVLWHDGTLYLVDQGGSEHHVYRSSDDGVTWDRTMAATNGPDRPWIVAADGVVALTFFRDGAQLVSRSLDGGITWTESPVTDTTYPGGRIAALADGAWVIPILRDPSALPGPIVDVRHCGPREVAVEVAVSRDAGATWQVIDTGARFEDSGEQTLAACGPSSTMPSFVAEGERWHVAWSEAAAGGQVIGLVSSPDAGATWSPATQPFGTAGASVWPWLASRGAGDLVLAGLVSPQDLDANVNPGPWRLQVLWSGDGGKQWQAQDLGPVHDGPICTGGGGCRSTDRSLGDFVQGAVAPDGRLGLTWTADLPLPEKGSQILVAVLPAPS